jgi:OPA family glycerol-3-phosphate transporter-like MFS transporter
VAKKSAPETHAKLGPASLALLAVIMLGVVLQGSLRDGVANWTPTYISEVFSLGSGVSILSGAVLPIFGILSIAAANFLYRKLLRNEMVCAGAIFGLGCAAALLLLAFHGKAPVLSVVALALLSGSMHGVNVILICMIPPHFAKFGRTAFVSGALNSCTYVGAAISTYGIALVTQSIGWNGTVLLWAVIAAAGAALCLALTRPWRTFRGH